MDLPQVVDAIMAEFEPLSTRVRDAVWRHLPGYEETLMRRDDLEQALRPNLHRPGRPRRGPPAATG